MVTVEADVVAGPLLAQEAEKAGVVYSLAWGDQPALVAEHVDWARTCGFEVVAAGKGTRMRSLLPKVLHRVCGRELVRLVVDSVKGGGFDKTVVVVAPDSNAIRKTLGDSVGYAVQSERRGTGHALLQARGLLEAVDTVAVLHGDVPLIRPDTLASMMRLHLASDACITLLTADRPSPDGMGRVVRDGSGRISAIVEESEADERILSLTEFNGGIYCFRAPWLWPHLEALVPSPRGEVFLTDLVAEASRQGLAIESVPVQTPEEILGVNTRVQLAQAEATLRQSLRERWMLPAEQIVVKGYWKRGEAEYHAPH